MDYQQIYESIYDSLNNQASHYSDAWEFVKSIFSILNSYGGGKIDEHTHKIMRSALAELHDAMIIKKNLKFALILLNKNYKEEQ